MPVNGVPSDQWRVERALGPYAERMDELELLEEQRLIRLKRLKYKGVDNNGQYTEVFTESG
ncbi:hypothetical protein [Halanaerobium congolense]|uniref:Uncharacterized protein n=1 Tax=Halanaerobium congolense TaxID=54121 RepID=A0A1G6TT67_9FIRM|nr:hypothetical protein [Halanaerobium congolense]PUU88755.1 MAG: hypothetical protein CI948_2201 [Halanaerobium sp.]SDD32303.1 hypothetical protein SAMN04488597_1552 [Halanaerobium congolense]